MINCIKWLNDNISVPCMQAKEFISVFTLPPNMQICTYRAIQFWPIDSHALRTWCAAPTRFLNGYSKFRVR